MCGRHEFGVHGLLWMLAATLVVAPGSVRADDTADDDTAGDDADDTDDGDADSTADEPRSLPGVTVTAGRTGATSAELEHRHPASVVAVDVDDDVPPSASVADLLEEVAGVHVRRFGGPAAPAYVSIRGSSSRQVEVWVDGVPLNAQGSSAVNLAELPLRAFDRVEIFRGGAPAELGASPMGGVVHLTTRPGRVPAPRVEAGFGSWLSRRVRAQAGAGGELRGGGTGDVRMSVEYEGTEGDFEYFDDNGTNQGANRYLDDRIRRRANNASERFAGSLRLRAVRGPVTLSLTDRVMLSDAGEPGDGHGTTEEAAYGVRENLVAGRAQIAVHPDVDLVGDLSWRLRGERYDDPLNEVGIGTQQTRDRYHQPTVALSARLRPRPWLTVLPSARTVVDLYRPVGLQEGGDDEALRVRAATTVSLGASLRPLRDHVDVQPAIGLFVLDNRALGTVPYDDTPLVDEDGDEVVRVAAMPRVALALRPVRPLTIRAAAGRGFRPPSFLELFGDRGRVVGNHRLKPETSTQFDVSVRVQGSPGAQFRGSLEVGGFHVRSDDKIVFIQNSQKTSVPANVGAERTSGIEVAAAFLAFEHVDVAGALTWTDSEILEANTPAHVGSRSPGLPEWELDVAGAVVFAPWVRVGVAWRFTAGTFDSPSNLFEQAPRSILDAHVRIQPGARAPWFAFELRNLTDTILAPRQRDPNQSTADDDRIVVPVTDYRGHPMPGRSFFLTVGWEIPNTPLGTPSSDPAESET